MRTKPEYDTHTPFGRIAIVHILLCLWFYLKYARYRHSLIIK